VRNTKRFPGTVRRWLTDRCEGCGHRFRWKRDARHSFGNRDGKVWHDPCISLVVWRGKAEERMEVLDVVTDLWEIKEPTVSEILALRRPKYEHNGRNLGWRVFYDLDNKRTAEATAALAAGGAS
jgi:hypothetical protein